jgi:mannose-1-phosphate guanylyltransferase/mannose-6-phosphate isomerase
MKLLSVILSGGAGTRLWPVSRQAHPKPFLELGGSTLLEQAVVRGQACGADELLLVTNEDHYHLSQSVLMQMGSAPATHFLLEPKGRNTAAAIALAALYCELRHGGDMPMLVLPADHLIPDTENFVLCCMEAVRLAIAGRIVVFGIQPTHPDTGFGYIEVAKSSRQSQPVLGFVEKPDLETAQEYLASGRYYWNGGMFCFTAATILAALREHAPEVMAACCFKSYAF